MPPTARSVVVLSLIPAVERFPDIPLVEPDLAGLGSPDVGLATAIHRTVLQRWLTLDHLIARHLKSPLRKLDAPTHAVLLTAAAQLIFLDRLPAYAVIDESVKLAKKFANHRSSGLVNAVLRKLNAAVGGRSETPWSPAPDRLPALDGSTITLTQPCLPKTDNILAHLVIATSHPLPLLQHWFKQFGRQQATALALHGLQNPPTFVTQDQPPRLWTESREALAEWLAQDSGRRVQDPASWASVAAAAELDPPPASILDLCAGRGTKTRQLRALFPKADITAHDPDDARRADLCLIPGINVAEPTAGQTYDLILLDVPCSNTGVLARRPGARYRANQANLNSLINLQRDIIDRAMPHLAAGGHLLYCTCSIDDRENQQQAQALLDRWPGRRVVKQETLLPVSAKDHRGSEAPSGVDPVTPHPYRDGSYHALITGSPGQ